MLLVVGCLLIFGRVPEWLTERFAKPWPSFSARGFESHPFRIDNFLSA